MDYSGIKQCAMVCYDQLTTKQVISKNTQTLEALEEILDIESSIHIINRYKKWYSKLKFIKEGYF